MSTALTRARRRSATGFFLVAVVALGACSNGGGGRDDVAAVDAVDRASVVTEAAAGAVAVELQIDGFELVDVNVPDVPVDRQGHAVLHLDDDEPSTVFSRKLNIRNLPPGQHQLRVVLVAADNQPWLVDRKPVADAITFTVKG